MSYIDSMPTPEVLQEQPGDEHLPFSFIIRERFATRMKALRDNVPQNAVEDDSPYEKMLADIFLQVLVQSQMLFDEAMEDMVSRFENDFGGKNNG